MPTNPDHSMSESNTAACPACGARLPADADVCDLCGTPVDAVDLPQVEDARTSASTTEGGRSASAPNPSPRDGAVYCNACGWENPTGARYCSQCGEQLQELESARTARTKAVAADLPPGSDPDVAREEAASPQPVAGSSSIVTRQVGMIVGAALLLVVGLFLVTTWSQRIEWGNAASDPAATEMPPGSADGPVAARAGAGRTAPADLQTLVEQSGADSIPGPLRKQIATLEEEIAQLNGAERRTKRQELVNLYVGAGQLGRAALAQQRIAENTGASEEWRRTGDLLYSWLERLEGQPPSPAIAQHVVQAYQKFLDEHPDDLDVRTDLATAYLQTNNPMRGVQEINRVLEQDPDHFQARFNKGVMLTMIGRAEDAIAQFERVKEIVGPDSPYYRQADQVIQTIQERMDREGDSS